MTASLRSDNQAVGAEFTVRPYRSSDRQAVRQLAGEDEFGRPYLASKYSGYREYLADSVSHYYDLEPESMFIAESDGAVIGNLLGAVDTKATEKRQATHTHHLRRKRLLTGGYGLPFWLIKVIRSERVPTITRAPYVDPAEYPAHLHIGVNRKWRRRGIGSALMTAYENYLRSRGVAGYHLYASSFHYQGMSFYRKFGLEELGQFLWHFYDGRRWIIVTETVFVRSLSSN
ncbi:MAG: GNAT family N-acetyltransferase [Dehalococcoidales bacterium]|nr:MAG: GNAT family N-acetyltransferase [Dehalococcoidales bacterium]